MDKFTRQVIANLVKYDKEIARLYEEAIEEIAKIASSVVGFDPSKTFDISRYPSLQKKFDAVIDELPQAIQISIENGIKEQWQLSNTKNDELADKVLGASKASLAEKQLNRYYSNNENALKSFLKRKEGGLNLSKRVWNYTEQFKEQIELSIDLALRDGTSAAKLSRELKQYLNDPDRLFRRVRDEHGVLHLSKKAKSFNPGQGVYRSSHKNAMRLARTEINMSYRSADYERFQQLDFIVGYEIKRSGRVYNCSVCSSLVGRYPKTFKFVGFHPNCRCYVVTILKTEKEIAEDTKRLLEGKAPLKTSKNTISDTPKQFQKWVKDNEDRIKNAKTMPFFLRDNKTFMEDALNTKKATVTKSKRKKSTEAKSKLDAVLLKLEGVEYNKVGLLKNKLTESEIIERLGGGDKTKGSCSSLAYAYAGNKGGFDVLDFRGGESLNYFALVSNNLEIAEALGGIITKNKNGYKAAQEALLKAQKGREYYFSSGSHVAIIRRTDKGFEYLELQSVTSNGFKPLDNSVLKWRFGTKKSRTVYGSKVELRSRLLDIELLYKDDKYRELLGYINTLKEQQLKGVTGTMK